VRAETLVDVTALILTQLNGAHGSFNGEKENEAALVDGVCDSNSIVIHNSSICMLVIFPIPMADPHQTQFLFTDPSP